MGDAVAAEARVPVMARAVRDGRRIAAQFPHRGILVVQKD
jgi:hypothetical protein